MIKFEDLNKEFNFSNSNMSQKVIQEIINFYFQNYSSQQNENQHYYIDDLFNKKYYVSKSDETKITMSTNSSIQQFLNSDNEKIIQFIQKSNKTAMVVYSMTGKNLTRDTYFQNEMGIIAQTTEYGAEMAKTFLKSNNIESIDDLYEYNTIQILDKIRINDSGVHRIKKMSDLYQYHRQIAYQMPVNRITKIDENNKLHSPYNNVAIRPIINSKPELSKILCKNFISSMAQADYFRYLLDNNYIKRLNSEFIEILSYCKSEEDFDNFISLMQELADLGGFAKNFYDENCERLMLKNPKLREIPKNPNNLYSFHEYKIDQTSPINFIIPRPSKDKEIAHEDTTKYSTQYADEFMENFEKAVKQFNIFKEEKSFDDYNISQMTKYFYTLKDALYNVQAGLNPNLVNKMDMQIEDILLWLRSTAHTLDELSNMSGKQL